MEILNSRRESWVKQQIPTDKLELYDRLVAANPSVERKGVTMPYTSLNGHMFSFLTKTGVFALRLPAEERDAFLKKFFDLRFASVNSLKPKPTKRTAKNKTAKKKKAALNVPRRKLL